MSCSDPCDEVNCGANGQCNEGICLCDDGFEGENCETASRDRFLGFWEASVYGCMPGNNPVVNYTLSAAEKPNEIQITTETTPVLLLIGKVDSTSFEIKSQIQFLGVDVTFYGTGVLENDMLTLEIIRGITPLDEITCKGIYFKN